MATRTKDEALGLLAAALDETGVGWEPAAADPYTLVATLPGTRKLSTTCALRVGDHTLSVNAFVIRRPDENHEAVFRWLLERNTRLYGLGYALDQLGDVYLTGRLPLEALSAQTVDRLLGTVLENADEPFNTLLELGFSSAIRREWEWRTKRGESTRNLAAFKHLAQQPQPQPQPQQPQQPQPES
ncbi:YbjN domain-containing protein [Kitasatospora sp. NBC_01287]|uniref:YbjN domain-containing protein n=1 Tax=Kitasatospora sp. NBC_01287 TaxID=2903573 RepID=UPI00224CABBD|nr:YbjN domain-containing protein [Kitasatospora sp. NBC_01287]MCX4748228.1 YbjN domain-containing protein [Kitasatospora sp. NBC_01287]